MFFNSFNQARSLSAARGDDASLQRQIAIVVSSVRSPVDVTALADLRYDEWIQGTYHDTTRAAFRAATVDMYQERVRGGATAFLARLEKDDVVAVVVGAAELSPIELQGAVILRNEQPHGMLYVTDVVTSRSHRRQGVAHAVMVAVEEAAASNGARHLLLHVDPCNESALMFYRSSKLGYVDVLPPEIATRLDAQKLAEDAGVEGQILLSKTISAAVSSVRERARSGGFGTRSASGGSGIQTSKKKRVK